MGIALAIAASAIVVIAYPFVLAAWLDRREVRS
jgi:hypothetical protein